MQRTVPPSTGDEITAAVAMLRRGAPQGMERLIPRRDGERQQRVSLDDAESGGGDALTVALRRDDLLALDDALERLAAVDARLARVVECRFSGGLTEDETAESLGVSRRTVANDWVMAKGWLYRALYADGA